LHPYHGERALAALGTHGQPVALAVRRHHERLDGSGYDSHVKAPDLSPPARILAAAEAYQTAREARPHRPAISAEAAAGAGTRRKLCPDATEAVLTASGQASRRATAASTPAGLKAREMEVLGLIAAGHTAKEAAPVLKITPNTADLDLFATLSSDDLNWETPGTSSSAGLREGREAVYGQFGIHLGGTDGSFKAGLQFVTADNEGRAIGAHRNTGMRLGEAREARLALA